MYEEAYLIKGIFEEAEIANFTTSDIESLGALLDDKLSEKVLAMIKRVKSSRIANDPNPWAVHLMKQINLFESLLSEKANRYVFHLKVAQKGSLDVIGKLDIESVYDVFEGEEGVKQGIEIIEHLLNNRHLWITELDPRRKDDYEVFKSNMALLARRADVMAANLTANGMAVSHCSDLDKRISDNKTMFYHQNEKGRKTGIGIVLAKENTMKIVLHGFNYRKIIQKEKLTQSQWRKV